jgi:hypothetical protein
MRCRLSIGLLLALLTLVGCQGGGARPVGERLSLTNFQDGTTPRGVSLEQQAGGITLRFAALPAAGQLLHLGLPAGEAVSSSTWSATAQLLQLVAPVAGGADIGVVPLQGFGGEPLTLTLRLGPAARMVSDAGPPTGSDDALFDLALEQGGAGQVRLSWTEVNRGDFDFNGRINIADLTPLGKLFGQRYDPNAPDAANQTVYWVDGDRNGEVNIADLTFLGKHLGSSIDGYTIVRNGSPVKGPDGSDLTAPRSLAQVRPGLPPRYTVVLSGSPVDSWGVEPTFQGITGSGNSVPPVPLDLSVKLTTTGLSLYSLAGSGTGMSSSSYTRIRITSLGDLMRVIDPIEDPYGLEIGSSIGATSGNAGFNGLPRGQWLAVQMLFAPTVDPATGQPLAWNASAPHYVALHVPVFLPAGTASSQLAVSTTFTRLPSGTYTVRIASLLQAGQRLQTTALLDFAAQQVSVDTNHDGRFDDELWLPDPRECGLSTPRLQQLVDYADYAGGTNDPLAVDGYFGGFDTASGELTTTSNQLTLPSGNSSPSTLVTLFNEATTIKQTVIGPSGQVTSEIGPAGLQAGDEVKLSGYALDGVAGHGQKLWVTGVTRVVHLDNPDKLSAFPSKTLVWPGEEVTVTVSSDHSASPFYSLPGVRITYNNATYVSDSFNAGSPGGARDAVDGIWSQVGATGLDLPLENDIVTQSQQPPQADGRMVLDFFVLPQNGSAVASPASGDLFNFKLSVLGTVTLGIQRLDDQNVKRSFYADQSGFTHYWSDDYNAGVPDITVQDPGGPGGPGAP